MQVTDFDKKIDTAIFNIELAIDEIEREANETEIFPVAVDLCTDILDFVKAAFQLAELRQQLKNMKSVHRIFKLNDAMKISLLNAYQNGEKPQPFVVTETYTVTELDTLGGIGIKLGIDWKRIADYNNLDSESLTAGTVLSIPRVVDPETMILTAKSSPVFDLPYGERVFGTDLPNILEIDTDGDFKVLNNRATFLQGMENILNTDVGSLPFYPNFGLETWLGDDIPAGVNDTWIRLKVQQSFLKDKRVHEVPLEEIEIERSGEGMTISVNVYPVHGLDFSTVASQTYFK